ncbi:hypothetical protein MKZ91_07445 [Ensifer sp. MJa1]
MVGARLKALYQAVENEPVPALFIELLGKLEAAEALISGSGKDTASSRRR